MQHTMSVTARIALFSLSDHRPHGLQDTGAAMPDPALIQREFITLRRLAWPTTSQSAWRVTALALHKKNPGGLDRDSLAKLSLNCRRSPVSPRLTGGRLSKPDLCSLHVSCEAYLGPRLGGVVGCEPH